jgi:cytochrome c oxidase cbb3-type subunit 3
VLKRDEIENVVAYVRSLSAPIAAQAKAAEAGRAVFAANCASCHGDAGKGNPELGAPDLTDNIWLYGGDEQSIYMTVWGGRQGHMPTWESRLSALDRKILTLYLVDLRTVKP